MKKRFEKEWSCYYYILKKNGAVIIIYYSGRDFFKRNLAAKKIEFFHKRGLTNEKYGV